MLNLKLESGPTISIKNADGKRTVYIEWDSDSDEDGSPIREGVFLDPSTAELFQIGEMIKQSLASPVSE